MHATAAEAADEAAAAAADSASGGSADAFDPMVLKYCAQVGIVNIITILLFYLCFT
jgi:hypothetical protein